MLSDMFHVLTRTYHNVFHSTYVPIPMYRHISNASNVCLLFMFHCDENITEIFIQIPIMVFDNNKRVFLKKILVPLSNFFADFPPGVSLMTLLPHDAGKAQHLANKN